MSEIRKRIEQAPDSAARAWDCLGAWKRGNLIPADDPLVLATALQACLKDVDPKGVRVPADEVDARIAEAVSKERAKWANYCDQRAAANRDLPPHSASATARAEEATFIATAIRESKP